MDAASPHVTRLPARGRHRGVPPSEAERLAEISSVLLASADNELRYLFLNGEWERMLGWLPEELAGRSITDLMHPDERDALVGAFAEARGSGRAEIEFVCRVATRDGRWRWIDWTVRHEQGRWYGAGQDVTERRAKDEELKAGRERLAEAQRVAGLGSFALDVESGAVWASDHYFALFGVDPAAFEPSFDAFMQFIHPEDREAVLGAYAQARAQGPQGGFEFRIVRPGGDTRILQSHAEAVRDETGTVTRMVGTLQDVTERRAAERQLAAREAQLRALIEQVPAVVYTAGPGVDAKWDFVSPQIETLLGYSPEEWESRRELWWEALHPDDRAHVLAEEERVDEPGGRLRSEYRLRHRDGSWVWVRDEATVLEGADGALRHQGVLLDITDRKRAEAAAREKHSQLQAIIDNSPLLIWARDREGRHLFSNREHELAGLAGAGADLESDCEVFEHGRPAELERRTELHGRMRTYLVQKFPLRDDGGEVYAVCGIATDITERKEREEELRAKVEWSFRIRQALEEDRLVLHGQPIVELATGRVVQEELLLRMRGDHGELLPPGEFLPPAERFHLAPAIDRWVIARAAEIACERRVEVNLSGQSIGDPSLADYVEACLAETGANPGNIVFEITETAAARDLDHVGPLAERLAWLGCGFALDDFGTGYGSFTYLKRLPVRYIKIDMEFVRGLSAESPDRQVVSAIVDVARNFGIQTIAEGVECAETAELLRELGVDYAQGYHFGRPGPL